MNSKQQYRLLIVGEKIQANDEYQRNERTWITLNQRDISAWICSLGSRLVYNKGDLVKRRPIVEGF